MQPIDDIYEFYREQKLAKRSGGKEMVQLLDMVADILRSKVLFFSTSHTKLWISKIATYPECVEHPAVGIYSDGLMIDFDYHESWRDGPFFRRREEAIRCELEHAKTALLEMLARLKPAAV